MNVHKVRATVQLVVNPRTQTNVCLWCNNSRSQPCWREVAKVKPASVGSGYKTVPEQLFERLWSGETVEAVVSVRDDLLIIEGNVL